MTLSRILLQTQCPDQEGLLDDSASTSYLNGAHSAPEDNHIVTDSYSEVNDIGAKTLLVPNLEDLGSPAGQGEKDLPTDLGDTTEEDESKYMYLCSTLPYMLSMFKQEDSTLLLYMCTHHSYMAHYSHRHSQNLVFFACNPGFHQISDYAVKPFYDKVTNSAMGA